MSYNLVDPVTGELTRVAGNVSSSAIIDDSTISGNKTFSSNKIKTITDELRKFILSKTDYQGIDAYPTECGVYRIIKKIDGIPNDASQYAALIIYGNGYFTHIYHDTVSGRMWIGYTVDKVKAPTWQELATMDKVNALHKETTGYITGSLLGSVVKEANLYYQKFGDSRFVINGWVSIDAVSTKTLIFTLPNNWKANSNYLIPCYVEDSNVACACMIDITKGTVNSYTPLPATRELRFCGEIYLI